MARPAPPSFSARVAFEGHYGPAKWANVMWLTTTATGVPTSAQVDSLAAALYTQYTTHFLSTFVPSWQIELCSVTYFPAGTDTVVYGNHTQTTVGSNANTVGLPASSAIVVSWVSNVFWRGGKPRTYLTGIPQAALTNSTSITALTASNLQANALAFITGVNAIATAPFTNVTLVLMSFFSSKTGAVRPASFPITDAKVGTRVDSQRRRLGKEVV